AADGRFLFTNLPPGKNNFAVTAKGFAPLLIAHDLPLPEPLVIEMNSGRTLRARVVNQRGEPVEDARVGMETDSASGFEWGAKTDSAGRVVWEHAPAHAISLFYFK